MSSGVGRGHPPKKTLHVNMGVWIFSSLQTPGYVSDRDRQRAIFVGKIYGDNFGKDLVESDLKFMWHEIKHCSGF